jgi:predicted outer membrane protein
MRSNLGTRAVFGSLLVAVLLGVADTPRAETKTTGWWPETLERTFRDALSFSREMMARIHHANQVAIQVGRLAEEHAGAPEVRRYGRLLVADRQQTDQQLLDYATTRMGMTLGPPEFVMGAEHDIEQQRAARVEHLRTLSGLAFDRELLALVWGDNRSAIELVDHARTQVDDPNLRIMFDKTLPILQQHEKLIQVLGSKAARATEGR